MLDWYILSVGSFYFQCSRTFLYHCLSPSVVSPVYQCHSLRSDGLLDNVLDRWQQIVGCCTNVTLAQLKQARCNSCSAQTGTLERDRRFLLGVASRDTSVYFFEAARTGCPSSLQSGLTGTAENVHVCHSMLPSGGGKVQCTKRTFRGWKPLRSPVKIRLLFSQ